jgi:hypothetical protein
MSRSISAKIGQDRTDTIDYVGSPNSHLSTQDFMREQRRDFSIRKESSMAFPDETEPQEITRHEVRLIAAYQANSPAKGYLRQPTFRG